MKEKSVVLVEFTGREIGSGRVVDTTSEKTAKEAGMFSENAVFGPVTVVVGRGDVLPGLDEALLDMKEGEARSIKLSAEKAFGQRRKELVVIVPLQEFHKRQIRPVPGLIVDLNDQYGRVQTVSGGRVRVDMNSDLAGKDMEYELRIVREVKDAKEKAQLLTEKFFPLKQKAQTRLEKGELKIKFPKEVANQFAPLVAPFTKTMKETVPEITKVEIVDSFEESRYSPAQVDTKARQPEPSQRKVESPKKSEAGPKKG